MTHEFAAMGTTIVVAGATPAQEQAIERLFAEREERFSPFREDSELSAVNRAAGQLRAGLAALRADATRRARGIDGDPRPRRPDDRERPARRRPRRRR